MWFWIIDDHWMILWMVSVLHCFLLYAVCLLLFLGFLSYFSVISVLSSRVFFIPIFLVRTLPLSVHHIFLDKDYINDLSTTLESRLSWTLHLSSYRFCSEAFSKSLHFCLHFQISKS